ncbi:MAG: NAD-dependent epimerase/dehydratase family protein [Acidobacteriota bacterium]
MGSEWHELPPAIGDGELAAFASGIAAPVAVTGATGFVGSHLVEALLRAGLRPRVLARDPARLDAPTRESVDVVVGDLGDPAALAGLVTGASTVVHLAGVVRAGRAAEFDAANRGGTSRLVAARDLCAPGAFFVHVSSLAAAGPSPRPEGRSPDEPASPVSAYGRSKLAGEEAVRGSAGPWVILRPPAIYGPRETDVLQFFRLAARGLVPLPAGERWVTMAHVADIVRAILSAAALRPAGRTFHLGEPSPLRMDELVGRLAAAGGVRARVVPVPPWALRAAGALGDVAHLVGARSVAITSDKARELLARHWSAESGPSLRALGLDGFIPFASGAAQAWAWYRERDWLPHAKISRQ